MYLNVFLQLKSITYCIWEILPFYKILVKPWDVDRGILREAQGTLGREWLRGCKCLASVEYLLGPVLFANAYAGFFKKCTLGHRVAALPFTSSRDLMYDFRRTMDVHKADETYLEILRINAATTTSDGPWTNVLRGCKCLASVEYLLAPVLLANAYAGFF
jgi:hypothetical protein